MGVLKGSWEPLKRRSKPGSAEKSAAQAVPKRTRSTTSKAWSKTIPAAFSCVPVLALLRNRVQQGMSCWAQRCVFVCPEGAEQTIILHFHSISTHTPPSSLCRKLENSTRALCHMTAALSAKTSTACYLLGNDLHTYTHTKKKADWQTDAHTHTPSPVRVWTLDSWGLVAMGNGFSCDPHDDDRNVITSWTVITLPRF